ncbi:hypothetical protein MHYP_G00074590 [Metynnis hypsauchen]
MQIASPTSAEMMSGDEIKPTRLADARVHEAAPSGSSAAVSAPLLLRRLVTDSLRILDADPNHHRFSALGTVSQAI